MKNELQYQVEIQRTNISPKQFFSYCKREAIKRTGTDVFSGFIDDFDSWMKPYQPCNSKNHYENGVYEICKCKPFDYHLFLSETYNFILEFNFDDEKKGWGYFYAHECKVD